jgi:hypothetical protein
VINRVTRILLLSAVLSMPAAGAISQELSPRAYWPAPKGTKVAVGGYSYTWGDVAIDPSLPVFGVDSNINTLLLAYLQTFGWFGRTTNLLVDIPFKWGDTEGTYLETELQRDFSGIGDIGVTLSVNVRGAPSMTVADYVEFRKDPHAVLGVSVKVVMPTGQYAADQIVNVGTNRWSVRTEFGYAQPIRRMWVLEVQLGTWFFGDNTEFVGVTREQDPIFAAQFHVVRRFKPGFWASLDANFYTGGQSTIGGEQQADLQRNSRFGGTVVVPVHGRHGIKAGYSTGVVTTSGGDFSTFLLSYTVVFM